MKKRLSLVAVMFVFAHLTAVAASQDTTKRHRILILLNGSATMAAGWQGTIKYEAGADFIKGLIASMYDYNNAIEVGLAVYGAQYTQQQNRCNDYRLEVPFERDNRTRIELRMEDIKPKGKASFNYAIAQAVRELRDTARYQYSILVVSDSSTQCGNDYCAIQTNMPLHKIYFAGAGHTPKYSCYSRVFQLIDREAMVQAIQKILPDFPKLKQEDEYWESSKDVPATTTLPRPTTAAVNIVRGNQLYAITLYRREKGVFVKMEELFFYGEQVKKMKLPFGNYKASYYIGTKEVAQEFVVKEGSTVDVLLD